MKWETSCQLVEVRVNLFVMVGISCKRILCWIIYNLWNEVEINKCFRKKSNWWYFWSSWERGRDTNTFRIIITNIVVTWMSFYSFSTPHFNFLWTSNLILLVPIKLYFSSSRLCQVLLSLYRLFVLILITVHLILIIITIFYSSSILFMDVVS